MQKTLSNNDTSKISLPAAGLALGAAMLTVLLLASLRILSPEFDPSWRMVSEYEYGHYGWVLALMFLSWGVSSCALAFAIWSQVKTRGGKIGLVFLISAGMGEAMASIFNINYDILHNVAGALGILGLPIAAMLISVCLGRMKQWVIAKKTLLLIANLTWISVVLFVITFALMVITYIHAGGDMTAGAKAKVLPHGVLALVGWANRFLVVVYCAWVATAAWQAIKLRRGKSQ